MTDYGYTTYGVSTTQASSGLGVGILVFSWVFSLLISALMIVSLWKIFKKLGKPGWAAIVPYYNIIVMLQIAGKEWYWLFGFIVPFLNIYLLFIIYKAMAEKLGKDNIGYVIGMLLLPVIFIPALAFSKAEAQEESANASEEQAAPEAPASDSTLATADATVPVEETAASVEPVAPSFDFAAPEAPVSQDAPTSMWGAPVAPAAPVEPVAPVAPAEPTPAAENTATNVDSYDAPSFDNNAASPVTPVEPATPVTPAAPVEPVAPVAPAAPAAPEAPADGTTNQGM